MDTALEVNHSDGSVILLYTGTLEKAIKLYVNYTLVNCTNTLHSLTHLCFLFDLCRHLIIVQVGLVVGLKHNPNTNKLLLDCVLGTGVYHLLLKWASVRRPTMVGAHSVQDIHTCLKAILTSGDKQNGCQY